jgi:hypothetical protein
VTHVAWIALVIILLGVYALAVWTVWRAPFRALGVLVAGAAVHNLMLMVLLRLGTPGVIVRIIQGWKEGILLLLFALVVRVAWRAARSGRLPKLLPIDLLMAAFAVIVVIYVLIPPATFGAHLNLSQRVLGARVLLQLPLLYLFGRVFFSSRRADLVWNLSMIAGAAGVVGLLGFVEVWFIPTRAWLDGGVNLLSSWLGFTYHGPQGLPENFFQPAGQALYIRRMVSTYVSPLPIAYTGLLVLPVATGLLLLKRPSDRATMLRVAFLAFLVIGVLLSVTRLAMLLLVAEFFVLAVIWRRRWLLWATPLAGVMVALVFIGYVRIGPLVDAHLNPVHDRPAGLRIVSSRDSSINEHGATLAFDIQYVLQHPLGTGVGTSIHRFGASQGTGESAYFDVFGETGLLGGLAYTIAYALILVYGLRAFLPHRNDPLLASLPLVSLVGGLALLPITLSSDVWSDPSLTYLLWWSAGYTVSLAALGRHGNVRGEPSMERASA